MEEMPLVSVVVPAHNAEKTLARLLDSLLAQSYPAMQIVLIDDGSRDRTGEIAREYAGRDSRITVISQEASGVSAARNRGMKICKGKYLRFADADDTLPPEAIASQVARAEEDGAEMTISGYTEYLGDYGRFMALVEREDTISAEENLKLINSRSNSYFYGVLWNKLYLREKAAGVLFDEELSWGEDFAYNMQYLKGCDRVAYMKGPVYDYRRNPQSATFRQVLDSVAHPAKNIRIKIKLYRVLKELYISRGVYPAHRRTLWIYLFRAGMDM